MEEEVKYRILIIANYFRIAKYISGDDLFDRGGSYMVDYLKKFSKPSALGNTWLEQRMEEWKISYVKH
jgi:hypothetical protein